MGGTGLLARCLRASCRSGGNFGGSLEVRDLEALLVLKFESPLGTIKKKSDRVEYRPEGRKKNPPLGGFFVGRPNAGKPHPLKSKTTPNVARASDRANSRSSGREDAMGAQALATANCVGWKIVESDIRDHGH